MDINTLESISPIDGRYRGVTENISKYFSEYDNFFVEQHLEK